MSKQRKKLRCICRGRKDRVEPGTDNQRHTDQCPLALVNNRQRT